MLSEISPDGNRLSIAEKRLPGSENIVEINNDLYEKYAILEETIIEKDRRIAQLERDVSDMLGSRITRFYRCSCGHLREKGIACPNPDCEPLSPKIIYKSKSNRSI